MRFKYFFFAFILLISTCNAYQSKQQNNSPPVLTSINIVDNNGFSETISGGDRLKQFENVDFLKSQPYQKVLRIYSRDANGDARAYVTSYHSNGQLKQFLEVVNNRAYGLYQERHDNGNVKVEATIVGGTADIDTGAEKSWIFEGYTHAWDEEGRLVAEIPYENGVLEGIAYYYHQNGSLWKCTPLHKNQYVGTSETYLVDGTLFQTTEYADGLKNGPSIRYWDGNKIASSEIYCEGNLSSGSYYDQSGKLISEVKDGTGFRAVFGKDTVTEMQEFRSGVQEGNVKIFDNQGVLASTHQLVQGLKHGEELEYYEGTSIPKLSIAWVEGKIQGNVKTWYPNGIPESQREMSGNKKTGVLTAWYRDGNLMMIEEYDQDKLRKGEYFLRGEKNPISTVNAGQGTATIYDSNGNLLRKVTYAHGKPQL